MFPKIQYLLVLGLILAVSQTSAEFWDDFRVTYNANPIGHFNRQPRTSNSSDMSKWKLQSSSCSNDGQFNGFQYLLPNDVSFSLLFDVNGVIAGIQALFDKNVIQANNTVNYPNLSKMYQSYMVNGSDYYLLTAYFVDPKIICTTGRNASDLNINGTGTGIWIQDGPSPANAVEVPKTRAEAIKEGYTKNNCFVGMGSHNFYRVEDYTPSNCTSMRPFFGLYNRAADMMGFGFIIPGTQINSHFENPPLAAVRAILGDTPECIADINTKIGQTSMHVYFVDTPWFIIC